MKRKTCVRCPHLASKQCGKVIKQRMSNGAIRYMSVPDERCVENKLK
ncbi:hypothetical protein [Parasporobacterium paucivorans]|nr:hypothetical protein [Parasporobacterium paucivorans]